MKETALQSVAMHGLFALGFLSPMARPFLDFRDVLICRPPLALRADSIVPVDGSKDGFTDVLARNNTRGGKTIGAAVFLEVMHDDEELSQMSDALLSLVKLAKCRREPQ